MAGSKSSGEVYLRMTITPIKTESIEIRNASGLDPIHVYFYNVEPGVGHVTITCFGDVWTAYFGAMSGQTIQEFFSGCDVGYLDNKLSRPKMLKSQTAYLERIIKAVQAALKDTVAA